MIFELLFFMVVAHCLTDMNQPSFLAKNKNRKPVIMFFHTFMVSGAVAIPMYLFGVFNVVYIGILIGSHMIIDQWKSGTPKDDEHLFYIYIDQGLHLLVMVIVAWMAG